jgi:hypothetical protein
MSTATAKCADCGKGLRWATDPSGRIIALDVDTAVYVIDQLPDGRPLARRHAAALAEHRCELKPKR